MLKKQAVELYLKQKESRIINVINGHTASIENGFLVVSFFRQGADGGVSGGKIHIEDDETYPEFKIENIDISKYMDSI